MGEEGYDNWPTCTIRVGSCMVLCRDELRSKLYSGDAVIIRTRANETQARHSLPV